MPCAQVGYGDFAPRTRHGRALAIPFALVAVSLVAYVLSKIQNTLNSALLLRTIDSVTVQSDESSESEAQRLARADAVSAAQRRLRLSGGLGQSALDLSLRLSTHVADHVTRWILSPRARKNFLRSRRRSCCQRMISCFVHDMSSLMQLAVTCCCLLVLVLLGAGVMYHFEGWPFSTAVYWAVVTLSTVGYGDFVPTKVGTKIFVMLFCLVGLAVMTTAISLISQVSLESTFEKGAQRILARMSRTAARHHATGATATTAVSGDVSQGARQDNDGDAVDDGDAQDGTGDESDECDADLLQQVLADDTQNLVASKSSRCVRCLHFMRFHETHVEMRDGKPLVHHAATRVVLLKHVSFFFLSILVLMAVVLAGAVVVHHFEPGVGSFLNAAYFCLITLGTLGFGDVLMRTTAMRVFVIFFIIFGLAFVMFVITNIQNSSSLLLEQAFGSVMVRYRKWKKTLYRQQAGVQAGVQRQHVLQAAFDFEAVLAEPPPPVLVRLARPHLHRKEPRERSPVVG